MAKLNSQKLTPEHVEATFRQLPQSTSESLRRIGGPAFWSMRINSILADTPQLPAGFRTLHPSLQVEHCIRQIAGEAALPAGGLRPADDASLNRLSQTLSTRATELTDSECIQSLIEGSDAARRGDTHFLKRTPLG